MTAPLASRRDDWINVSCVYYLVSEWVTSSVHWQNCGRRKVSFPSSSAAAISHEWFAWSWLSAECVKIKRPNTNIAISEKCVNIFAPNFALLFTHNCPQIWCFMPYLLDVRKNDENLNLKNKFCYWTNVDFSFQLGCDVSVTSKPIRFLQF